MKQITATGSVVTMFVILFIFSPPISAATPQALADEVVEDQFDSAQAAGVPGAIIHVSTPYWEGTWTRGTADLATGRPIGAGVLFSALRPDLKAVSGENQRAANARRTGRSRRRFYFS